MPWGPFRVILEYPGTERTDFSYSASIYLHSLTFSEAFCKVLGGGESIEKLANLAVSERGVIIFNEFD